MNYIKCPWCALVCRSDSLIGHISAKHIEDSVQTMLPSFKKSQIERKQPVVYVNYQLDKDGTKFNYITKQTTIQIAFCLHCKKASRLTSSDDHRDELAKKFIRKHNGCNCEWEKYADLFTKPTTQFISQLKLYTNEQYKATKSPSAPNSVASSESHSESGISSDLKSALKRFVYFRDNESLDGYESEDEEFYEQIATNALNDYTETKTDDKPDHNTKLETYDILLLDIRDVLNEVDSDDTLKVQAIKRLFGIRF